MSDDDHERSPHAWDLPPQPPRAADAVGCRGAGPRQSDRRRHVEIKAELKALNQRLEADRELRTRNAWEIKQLQDTLSGKDGVRDQLKEIREIMPDMRIIRSVLYGAGSLILMAIGYAILRAIGLQT